MLGADLFTLGHSWFLEQVRMARFPKKYFSAKLFVTETNESIFIDSELNISHTILFATFFFYKEIFYGKEICLLISYLWLSVNLYALYITNSSRLPK